MAVKRILLMFVLLCPYLCMAQNPPHKQKEEPSKKDSALRNVYLPELHVKSKVKKLPNVQKVSMQAPGSISVDGSFTEWKNRFKAFNQETGLFYAIANDSDHVYLIVQAPNKRVMNKMMHAGISFTVSKPGLKNDSNQVTVLFPLMPLSMCRNILHTAGKDISESPNGEFPLTFSNRKSIDSANADLLKNQQYIKVSGISLPGAIAPSEVKDYEKLPLRWHHFDVIPVDNPYHIKATTRFDKKGAYNYEMAIPLSYLSGVINEDHKFGYNITINARGEDKRPESLLYYGVDFKIAYNADMETPTDLWAEYTLAGY